jgi:hypothetical protein
LIDTGRYPLPQLRQPHMQARVAGYHDHLERLGCLVLPGFIRPEALAHIRDETRRLSPQAHFNDTQTNPYSSAEAPNLPESHPRNVLMDRSNGFVGGDLIPHDSAIRGLYHDSAFQAFIAACLGVEQIHEYADPIAGLVVNVLRPGCQHPWHFDTNEFIVTLMSQKPDEGGDFQYCPGIRTVKDENYDGVAKVLAGDREPVRTLTLRPGDLQIFFGRFALHRVARTSGQRERHTVILGYAKEPGLMGDKEKSKRIFGRSVPVEA